MVIDAHTHMPSEKWPLHGTPFATVAEAVAYLRAAGTDAALFTTWQGVFPRTERDLDEANEDALALAERHAEFLYPGTAIHPSFPSASRRWLARFREMGYLWVGELVGYGDAAYQYLDAPFLELCAECAAHGHILQLHNHADIVPLARQFPGMPIVCAHITEALCGPLAELPNTWVDISGYQGGLCIGAIEAACRALGPGRLLYGTDFTGYEPRCFQARLNAAVAEPEARQAVLWRNASGLIARTAGRPIAPEPDPGTKGPP